jgi:hypothetical protein
MKLIVLTAIAFVISFFSFQYYNKSKSQKSADYGEYAVSELADLSDKNLLSSVFYLDAVKTLQKSNYSYQVKHQKNLTLNLQSGKIIEKNDLDSEQREFCLAAESLQTLNALLQKAKICKFDKKESSDASICTQVVRPAYLELMTSTENYQLGFASDGCASNFVDLCDEGQKLKLSDVIKQIGKSYSEINCPDGF